MQKRDTKKLNLCRLEEESSNGKHITPVSATYTAPNTASPFYWTLPLPTGCTEGVTIQAVGGQGGTSTPIPAVLGGVGGGASVTLTATQIPASLNIYVGPSATFATPGLNPGTIGGNGGIPSSAPNGSGGGGGAASIVTDATTGTLLIVAPGGGGGGAASSPGSTPGTGGMGGAGQGAPTAPADSGETGATGSAGTDTATGGFGGVGATLASFGDGGTGGTPGELQVLKVPQS